MHVYEQVKDIYFNETIKFITGVFYPGSAGYIVSRKGAEYLLKLNEPIWLPSDGAFDRHWQNKTMDRELVTYYVDPPLGWQGNVKKTI
jgi:GR25 family glycosyltransferase involved in LPS biosynthesis